MTEEFQNLSGKGHSEGQDQINSTGYFKYVKSYVIKTFVKILSAYGSGLRKTSKRLCAQQ